MFHDQRLIWGTTELSAELNDFRTGSRSFAYAASGYLYVGQEKPFNNLWVDVASGNASGASLTAEIWYANRWNAAIDVSDGTVSGSASFAQSGRVSWNTAWNSAWDNMDRCSLITGLETFEIYDLYWMRFSWSGSFSGSTSLNYIGQKFCTETELTSFYPDLRNSNLKTAFGGNTKTTWDAEIYAATDQVINDLKTMRLIKAKGQIVDWGIFAEPCVHRTAMIIYQGLGSSFAANKADAMKAYDASMKKDKFRVDKDDDGKLSVNEKDSSTRYMGR